MGKAYPHAVWFYFPVAMLVKSSLTFLILLVISIWVIASGRLQKRRELAFLLIPALIYLATSMIGGMNIGIRHILPVYIFLAILIAGATSVLIKSRRHWLYAVVLLLLFQSISGTRTFPNYIGYANEAFGGPKNVWRYLSDSSVEWAQLFVYDGHFGIPLSAALAHAQRASILLAEKKLPEALQEAQQAVALAPDSARVNAVMGTVLDALSRRTEARTYYESALQQALTIQPDFQLSLVPSLKKRLAADDNSVQDVDR